MDKKCFKCGCIKPLLEFYKHGQMADGYLNKCKECTKNDSNKHREDNIEKIRAYDRNRPNHIERIKQNKERLENDPIAKQTNNKRIKEWGKQNRNKRNANQKLARAVLRGIVIRKYSCEKCESDLIVEAHHEDYNKPLEVIWLCSKCHHKRHTQIREQQRSNKWLN